MNATKADAKAIFLDALECENAEELARFLEKSCQSDAALRARVEELLRAHQDAGAFLNVTSKIPTAEVSSADRLGTMIGPYKLLEQIGEGGMGLVYMAQQSEPVRRRVAVKVIKPGMDTKQVIARFEAERQTLALMDHPHIAKVLDAGTTDTGCPYFVMDLVRGIPITDYCNEFKLTTSHRLQLFVDVCRAIQHAHLKGIIHRDLKPSNVLVVQVDGRPVVKVIDFGIAKAVGHQLTEKTLFTAFAQLVGTPLYMSPEQAALSGVDVDTRSDVYSLGVLLYELLTGTTPFSRETLSKVSQDELRRIIREEEPQRPSARLSTLHSRAHSTVSNRRSTELTTLSRQLRGELDWIVMKALEKDRSRRYESTSALAADVERYLNDKPVQACPPSIAYRLQKYCRRHRSYLFVSSIIFASLSIIPATMAVDAGKRAVQRQQTLEQVRKLLESAQTALKNEDVVNARQHAIEARASIGKFRNALPAEAKQVDDLMAELDQRSFDKERFEKFCRVAQEAQSRMGFAQGERGSNGGAGRRISIHATKMDLHQHYNAFGFSHWTDGDVMAREALSLFHVLSDPKWVKQLNESRLSPLQRRQVEETAYETLLSLALYTKRVFPPRTRSEIEVALNLLDRAASFHDKTRAYWFVRMALDSAVGNQTAANADREKFEESKPFTALDHYLPGKIYGWNFDFAASIPAYEAVLHLQPDHYNSLFGLADAFAMMERSAEAVQTFTACIALRPKNMHAYLARADRYEVLGRNDAAKLDYDSAVAFAPNDLERRYALRFRQVFFTRTGRLAEAKTDHEEAVGILKRLEKATRSELGAEHEKTIRLVKALGNQYGGFGEDELSIQCFEDVLRRNLLAEQFKNVFPTDDLINLSDAYRQAKLFEKEAELLKSWFDSGRSEPNGVLTRMVRERWGRVLVDQARYAEAEEIMRSVVGTYQPPRLSPKDYFPSWPTNTGTLGEALYGQGKFEEAERAFQESYDQFKAFEFEGHLRHIPATDLAIAAERLERVKEAKKRSQ